MQEDKKFSTKFLEHLDQTVTKKEFTKNIEELLKFLVAMQKRNDTEIQNLQETYAQVVNTLKEENGTDLEETKKMCADMIQKMMSEHQAKMKAVEEKMAEMKDGENGVDADEERVMEMVLAKIPPAKELEPETAEGIRDKLETLKEDDRLDASAIKGLLERIEKLESRPIATGGRGASPQHPTEYYDISSQCNGVLRAFTIPKNLKVLWLAGTDSPAGQYRAITDYTVSGSMNKTLTLDSSLPAPATGATLHILYKAFFNI